MSPDVVVDVGNTLIKWGRCRAGQLVEDVAVPPDDPPAWQRQVDAWFAGFHPTQTTIVTAMIAADDLIVMIVAIFIFAPLGVLDWYWLVLSRIIGIPLIIGISFELIKLAGKYRAKPWVAALIWPGMQLQRLTTQEPDEAQLEVAIAALQAVLEVERPGEATAEDLVGVEVAA